MSLLPPIHAPRQKPNCLLHSSQLPCCAPSSMAYCWPCHVGFCDPSRGSTGCTKSAEAKVSWTPAPQCMALHRRGPYGKRFGWIGIVSTGQQTGASLNASAVVWGVKELEEASYVAVVAIQMSVGAASQSAERRSECGRGIEGKRRRRPQRVLEGVIPLHFLSCVRV